MRVFLVVWRSTGYVCIAFENQTRAETHAEMLNTSRAFLSLEKPYYVTSVYVIMEN